jgi:uncharacterized protein (DUF924 family)
MTTTTTATMTATPNDVLDFWFGTARPLTMRKAWFTQSEDFDREIAQRFGATVDRALKGELVDWLDAPQSALAYILLLDQFTRNAFRGLPKSFAGDPLALAATRRLMAIDAHLALEPLHRLFVYLPLEHAEDLPAQEMSVRLFTELQQQAPEAPGLVDYAQRHRDIIARFGRFPHRNIILGRVSTTEEVEFLKQPGSSF